MRARAVLAVLLLAGCGASTIGTPAPGTSAPAPGTSVPAPGPAAGVTVTMTAERGGPLEQRFLVQARDDDASGSGIVLVFGDGEQLLRPPPVASCAAGPQPSREPRPFDTAYDVLHTYAEPGTYEVQARVTTRLLCAGAPDERATRTLTVEVG